MPKIAIIEDEPAISQLYRLKFEAEGYEVETATDGQHGLALIRDMQPDIVLLDLMMPGMNGYEVLAALRAADWGKEVKVIMLTNAGDQLPPSVMKVFGIRQFIVKANMTPRQVAEVVKQELAPA